MVNSAVKIEGVRGSRALSLHCQDREFTASFDALPYVRLRCCISCGGSEKSVIGHISKNIIYWFAMCLHVMDCT